MIYETGYIEGRIANGISTHVHEKEFNSFPEFLEFRKTSHPDDISELSMGDVSRKRRKDDGISVGGRF